MKFPLAVALPKASAIKLRFSVHAFPSQYNVELVAVPSTTTPCTVDQNVVVPLEARN